MSHTPGPWETSGQLIIGAPEPVPNPKVEPHGKTVAEVRWDYGGDNGATEWRIKWPEAEANLHLIAAAPELLSACEEVFRNCELFRTADNMAGRLCRIVESAIAKATGGDA